MDQLSPVDIDFVEVKGAIKVMAYFHLKYRHILILLRIKLDGSIKRKFL